MSAKVEVNGGAPLPQRPQKNMADKNKGGMDGPAEKKPRFNPNQNQNQQNRNNQNNNQMQNNQNQNKNFGGNKNFGNRKNQGGNQNPNPNMNKGNFQNQGNPNMNKGNFQNQQKQQQQQQQQQQQVAPPAPAIKEEKKDQVGSKPGAVGNAGPNNQAGPQNQQKNQQQHPNQNQQQQNQKQQQQNQLQNNQQQQNQAQNNQQQQNQQNQNMNRQQQQQQLNQQQQQGPMGFGGDGTNRGNRGQKRDRNFVERNFGPTGNRDFSRDTRDSMGPRGGPGMDGQRGGNRNDDFFVNQRLRSISGPTHEIEPIQVAEESKFSGRNRLYVGNLAGEFGEEDLKELFKPFGEIGEVFCNAAKNFAFLKMDFHVNAERAKRELDGFVRKGRPLRVRFAPNATILRVSNLTPFVSNELLYRAFEVFGPVERAVVNVDDRGKSTGEGIVEFAKKSSANICLRYCNEKCFFLTASLRPCVVEPYDANEDTDGLPDKSLNKKIPEFHHERGVGPRFADRGSFEHEYGTRWKQLYELYKSKQEALKRELKMEEEKLEAQMEYARYEHETELLRQELRKRESDNERKKLEWEMREKQAEEMRKTDEEQVRRQQTEMQSRMMRQEEEMRRRQQENTLFMQAQQLNSLLDQQEGGFSGNCNNFDGGFGGNNSNFDFRGNNGGGGNGPNGPNGPGPNNQQDFGFEFGGNPNQQGPNDGNRGAQRGGNNAANNNPWERRRRF